MLPHILFSSFDLPSFPVSGVRFSASEPPGGFHRRFLRRVPDLSRPHSTRVRFSRRGHIRSIRVGFSHSATAGRAGLSASYLTKCKSRAKQKFRSKRVPQPHELALILAPRSLLRIVGLKTKHLVALFRSFPVQPSTFLLAALKNSSSAYVLRIQPRVARTTRGIIDSRLKTS